MDIHPVFSDPRFHRMVYRNVVTGKPSTPVKSWAERKQEEIAALQVTLTRLDIAIRQGAQETDAIWAEMLHAAYDVTEVPEVNAAAVEAERDADAPLHNCDQIADERMGK